MEITAKELNISDLEQITGGELTEDMQRKLLAAIAEAKRLGGTMEQLIDILGSLPEVAEFNKENFWWVRSN